MIAFLTGPMFVIALLVFALGMLGRIVWYIRGLDWRLDRVAYKPFFSFGLKGGLYSAVKWLVPFATDGWRRNPLLSAATFIFHLGAVLVPLFLVGHAVIMRSVFGFSLPALPMWLADILTILIMVGLVLFALRRLFLPQVRALSTAADWILLLLVAMPVVSGFVAAHSGVEAEGAYIAHLITGNLFLLVAPFTKFAHIVLYFLSRIQIGMDFAIKRGGRVRGPLFPW